MVTTRKVPSTSHVSEHQGEDLIKDYFNKSSPSNLVLKLPKPVIDSDPVTNVFKSAFHNNRNVEYSAETSNSKLGIRSSHVSKIEHHAEGLIKDYLSFDKYSPYDLVLKLPEAVIDSEPVSNVVTLALHSKRKVEYNAETSILRILAMSRPVHDVIAMLVSRFLMKATSSGFLTSEEIDYVSCGHEGVPPQTPGHRTKRKPIARIKYPDSTIFFGNPDSKPIPRIVFKVGLSQLYEDLVSDAKQWLERSGGRVKVVIIVDIKETRIRRTDDTKERIKSLVATYGNNVARARYDLDVDVPDSESTALYEEVENLVKVEDWVGDLKAVLEVWQFSKDKFNIRQRVVSLSCPCSRCFVAEFYDLDHPPPPRYSGVPRHQNRRYHTRRTLGKFQKF